MATRPFWYLANPSHGAVIDDFPNKPQILFFEDQAWQGRYETIENYSLCFDIDSFGRVQIS